MARILALDYGERRIGVAMSDPTGTLATPLPTLQRRAGKRPPWAEIQKIVEENEVAEAVIGLPLELSGEESAWTAEVRAFGDDFARRTGLAVHWVDERMTSVAAERQVRGSGLRKTQREERGRVDAAAAALILDTFLTLRRNQACREAES
jgi:putative Holliday junction resolvase